MNGLSFPKPSRLALPLVVFLSSIAFPVAAELSKTIAIDGHLYELELDQNRELLSKLQWNHDPGELGSHFRGKLRDFPDSWVRVSQVDGAWQGVVSLGKQLFVVDEQSHSSADHATGWALAKISDLSATSLSDYEPHACGTETPHTSFAQAAETDPENNSAMQIASEVQFSSLCSNVINGVCLIAELELAFDLEFQSDLGSNAASTAVSLVNIVEGFYRNDFNIAFEALSMEFLSSEIASTTTDASDLLADVRSKKQNGAFTFIQNNQALFHFITGRDLDGGTAGIAYVDALCSANWGVGVTQLLSNTSITAIIMAHELGHNFGASHDGSGNSCGNGFIMQSTVSTSNTSFSSCSISTITNDIEQLSNPAQCFNFAVDAGISASVGNPTQVNVNQTFTLQYEVTSEAGYQPITTLEVNGSIPSGQGQFSSVTLDGLNCNLSNGNRNYQCSASNPPSSATLLVDALATGSQVDITNSTSITASNDTQDVNASNDLLVTHLTVVTGGVPASPSGLTATQTSGTDVALSWSDNSIDETGFTIERRISGGSFAQLVQIGANVTSYTDASTVGNTSYEYRVIAFNGSGDSSPSAIATINVIGIPSTPSGLNATQGTGTNVNLSWQDNSNSETNFIIERRVSGGNFSPLTQVGANTTSYTDTSTVGNTTYDYRVIATNSLGESSPSNIAQISVDGTPAAPTSLSATQGSGTQVNLSWTDNANNETGFIIERRVSGGSFSPLTQVGANTTSYTDTSTLGNTTYDYRVIATNSLGDSSPSNIAQISVDGTPAAPTSLSATQGSGTQVNLAWTDNANNETGFIIERRVSGGSFSPLTQVGANTTSYTDTSTVGNTAYDYRVIANNSLGDSSPSNIAQINISGAPVAPSALTVMQLSGTTDVVLAWQDNSNNETNFIIERRETGGNFSQLAQTVAGTTSYTDTNLFLNTTYEYRVYAINGSGSSAPTPIAQISITDVPPLAPSNLSATASGASVTLIWQDNSDNESAFRLDRRTPGGVFTELTLLSIDTQTFTDSDTRAGQTYEYRVVATNAAGESQPSNIVQLSISDIPAAPTNLVASQINASTQVRLTWQDNSALETTQIIERRLSGATFQVVAQVAADVSSFTDTSSIADTLVEYRVIARNSLGDSPSSNIAQVDVQGVPQTPSDLDAMQINDSTNISLVWQDNSDNETGFEIERRELVGSFTVLAQVGEGITNFTDTSTAVSTSYEYRVSAINIAGSSAPSNSVQITATSIEPQLPLPSSPSDLVATQGAGNSIELVWRDNSDTEEGFILERSNNNGAFVQIAQLSANQETYTDETVTGNLTYQYSLMAFNATGESSFTLSNLVDVIVTLPNQPSNLVVTQGNGSSVLLSWQDNSTNESGFRIHRREVEPSTAGVAGARVAEAEFAQIAQVSANVTSYTDESNANDVTFEYQVTAFNEAGVSTPTTAVDVTVGPKTPSQPPTVNNDSSSGGGGGNLGIFTIIALFLFNGLRRKFEPLLV